MKPNTHDLSSCDTQAIDVEWWLMTCSFPDLHWARLRCFADDSVDVLDHDGQRHVFSCYDEAYDFLREDEFELLINLDEGEAQAFGLGVNDLVPPRAKSDEDLVPLMSVSRRKKVE